MKRHYYWLLLMPCSLGAAASDTIERHQNLQQLQHQCQTHPKDWKCHYNLARAYDQNTQYDKAIAANHQALQRCQQKDKQGNIFYNLGHAYFEKAKSLQGQLPAKIALLEKSLQAYDAALAFDQTAQDAQANRSTVQKLLEELKKKQNKQQQQDNQQQNTSGKDQQKPSRDNQQQEQQNQQPQKQEQAQEPAANNPQQTPQEEQEKQSANEEQQTSELLLKQEQQNEKLFPVHFSAPQNHEPVLKDW